MSATPRMGRAIAKREQRGDGGRSFGAIAHPVHPRLVCQREVLKRHMGCAGEWACRTRNHQLATTGPYRYVRHPQYLAFTRHHGRLLAAVADARDPRDVPHPARQLRPACPSEEREVAAELGDAWTTYAARTPRWLPRSARATRRRAQARILALVEEVARQARMLIETSDSPKAGPAGRRGTRVARTNKHAVVERLVAPTEDGDVVDGPRPGPLARPVDVAA